MAVKREGTIVDHLLRKIMRVCSPFLRRGGSSTCTITGHRRYSAEVPCSLLFKATPKDILKLKKIWKNNSHWLARMAAT